MGRRTISLGLLEFGELPLAVIFSTARLAERLGFARYWISEHRGLIENAMLLTPLVANATSHIRVGPAGVLLRYYPAMSVARDGILLEQAFPGRIDLGLAGGRHAEGQDLPFLDGRTHLYAPETFDDKLRIVGETVAAHTPARERPEVWVLGSSDSAWRGQSAARARAHFCLSLMHAAEVPSPAAIVAFREEERRHRRRQRVAAIAVLLCCIESPRERRRHRTPFPGLRGPVIVESGSVARERIEELCAEYGATEVSILECSDGPERRRTSMQVLMEAFGGRRQPRRPARASAET
jgi:alkanesulfonate monooxygenase SsuD/methylene tetrahydromethanopterin reductase-like flavin-dependent oxidoreductase (luciferase family)